MIGPNWVLPDDYFAIRTIPSAVRIEPGVLTPLQDLCVRGDVAVGVRCPGVCGGVRQGRGISVVVVLTRWANLSVQRVELPWILIVWRRRRSRVCGWRGS